MQIPRPPAIGDRRVVDELRSVIFSEPILGATGVRPKGYMKGVLLTILFGWLGPLVARRATEPLTATVHYLAVTAADIRLFSKPAWADAFEIGRWKKGGYHATLRDDAIDLNLQRLGRVTLTGGAREVLDLVVQGAAGPVG